MQNGSTPALQISILRVQTEYCLQGRGHGRGSLPFQSICGVIKRRNDDGSEICCKKLPFYGHYDRGHGSCALLGWFWPIVKDADGNVLNAGATVLKPIGTVFINMMFCIVVPLVFASISSAVANMKSRKRAGKIEPTTAGDLCRYRRHRRSNHVCSGQHPSSVLSPTELPSEEMGEYASQPR